MRKKILLICLSTVVACVVLAYPIFTLAAMMGLTSADGAQVNTTQEIVLESTANYPNPYTDAAINAVFTGPSGQKMTVPGFWAGGKTWKIRFAPTAVGNWSYTTQCTNQDDAGLNGKTGTIKAVAYSGDNELYKRGRLRVSDDKTYLTYKDGTPFPWLSITNWFALTDRVKFTFTNRPGKAEDETMFHYQVDTWAQRGYTAMLVQVFPYDNTSGISNDGGNQWLDSKQWQVPNPDYWNNVDERIKYITDKGLTVVIGDCAAGAVTEKNLESFKEYHRYLMARYASYPVIWQVGVEWGGSLDLENTEIVGELGAYVHDIDPYENLCASFHTIAERHSADAFIGQQWFDFILYTGIHSKGFAAYPGDEPAALTRYEGYNLMDTASYRVPFVEVEAKFEDLWEIPNNETREIAYLSIMNGGFGYGYSAEGIWQATYTSQDEYQTYGREPTPWYKAMEKPVGAVQAPNMNRMFLKTPFWKLKCDKGTLVDWDFEVEPRSVLRPTVKATEDKSWILIYYPINNPSLNSGEYYSDFTGVVKGLDPKVTYVTMWYDTIKGKYTTISNNVKANADGTYKLPKPADLTNNEYMFIMRRADATDIATEYTNAAYSQKNNVTYSRVTGEKALPVKEYLGDNTQTLDFGTIRESQGMDNFYYYVYNHVSKQYSPMKAGASIYEVWGPVFYAPSSGSGGADAGNGFICQNQMTATNPNAEGADIDSANAIIWVAPEDGKVQINSRPAWKDMWNPGGKGATVTLMLNAANLAEFAFDGVNYKDDSYLETIDVKKGDYITFAVRSNEKFSTDWTQVYINTVLYYSPNK